MNDKRVLVISQVIPQWYVDLLTRALGKDVQIDIITGSNVKGNVIHSPEHDARSFKSRLISWYKHYRFITKWTKENKRKSYNLIFAVSNPPINPIIGLKLKKVFDAPFVYMNWDLYPQVVEETIDNPIVKMICRAWHEWNSKHYPEIDRMLTIGDVMAASMKRPLKTSIDVTVLPIAVDTDYLKPVEKKNNPFAIQHGITDKFVVLYSGKMGMGHNIELILDAAEHLRDNTQIQFVFIGFGPKYSIVEEFIEEHSSKNILLLPLQPDEIFPYSISCGDVGIVTQEASMAHLFMPSKTYSMMACGEAIIGIGTDHDDLSILIRDEEIGESVTDGTVDSLVERILLLLTNRELLVKYKETSRKVAERKYAVKIVENEYSELFKGFL